MRSGAWIGMSFNGGASGLSSGPLPGCLEINYGGGGFCIWAYLQKNVRLSMGLMKQTVLDVDERWKVWVTCSSLARLSADLANAL
ncbi:hypothetical protein R1flu_000979 [Riccia fluitans]|uniref:Uncharacterized protein n=1 Tax=Riccia fluitans TaxID=41844 RepID=A0ABD1Y1Z5_9MARC